MRLRNDITTTYNKQRKRWLVRWYGKYDPNKDKQQRFCRSFKRKRDAQQFAQSLKDDLQDGISIEPKVITLHALCDRFLKAYRNNRANATIKTYEEAIYRLKNYFLPNTPLQRIKKEDALGFVNSLTVLRKGIFLQNSTVLVSDSTRDKLLRTARRIFAVAKDWGYIRKNCFQGVSLGRIKKDNWYYISPEEFHRILQAVDDIVVRKKWAKEDADRKVRLKGLYGIMYGCGLRFGEGAGILYTNGNIDWENNQIHITNRPGTKDIPAFYIKDYEDRSIPAPRWVMDLLKECRKLVQKGNPFLFLGRERYDVVRVNWQKHVSEGKEAEWRSADMLNNYARSFKKACRRAGIETDDRLMASCCRKSYGTNLANLGTPVHTLKELMGHSSIITTQKYYLKSTDANKKQAVEGLDRLME